ncbi:uncharacterized protein LOC119172021 isoform X1 [Rhipicephalus microplus]|uniref:uncharacterized protein LOC119172021 isoform X1 n=1 Tax=Rhipicephalus microplus TaxID=6941 RepID=UPI003F6C755A
MELVREFGDPHVLTLAEDHIVLKLELPWPRDVEFPQGISLADDDGLLLVGNRESFVSARQSTLTRVARICKALFCGCASFDSWDRYASAATNLLRDAEEICIVHNRDKVHKLVRMFPNVKVLALLHDLCEHYVELDEPCRDLVAPLVEGSQLRKLVCSASNLYDGYLVMSHETTLALLRTCPDMSRIDSPWVMQCFTGPRSLPISLERSKATNITHLLLSSWKRVSTDWLPAPVTAGDMTLAAKTFPAVETLQVYVRSAEALSKISAFRNLRSLTLKFNEGGTPEGMDLGIKHFPDLEELTMEGCDGVMLSKIAERCPQIKILRLLDCTGSTEDVRLDARAFSNLESVTLRMWMLQDTFASFLSATHKTLRTAWFGDSSLCVEFLHHSVQYGQRLPFSRLEHLGLCTKSTLREMELEPRELHHVLKALPVIRHLETDSYDLRLFFENYCVPRGQLCLSWTGCVSCEVYNPELARRFH